MITTNQSPCVGGWCGVCRLNEKLSKVTAKDLVVFQLQHCYGLERLEFRYGVYGLTGGGCGQNLAHYLSSLERWIALSSILASTLIF